jgi:predicted DNA-binding transcriptional regulator YafY
MLTLNRIQGLPQFQWIEEMVLRLQNDLKMNPESDKIIDFEENPYLKGMEWFAEVFTAIRYKKSIEIKYQSFSSEGSKTMVVHPYFLKKYNNRWFLLAYNPEFDSLSNIALDRVKSVKESSDIYIENTLFDFNDYFEDIIGVTKHQGLEPESITIKADLKTWPYIDTKPLHGSQKVLKKHREYVLFHLELIENHELISKLLSYRDGLEVISPSTLREKMKVIVKSLNEKYDTE